MQEGAFVIDKDVSNAKEGACDVVMAMGAFYSDDSDSENDSEAENGASEAEEDVSDAK